jgi:hypothetical protein
MRAFSRLSYEDQRAHLDKINGRTDGLKIVCRINFSKRSRSKGYKEDKVPFPKCGHADLDVAAIMIPDDLVPYCEEQGWYTTFESWGLVAVIRHPRLAKNTGPTVTPSDKCAACTLEDLRKRLDRIKADAAAMQGADQIQVPSSHTRTQIRRGRRKSA